MEHQRGDRTHTKREAVGASTRPGISKPLFKIPGFRVLPRPLNKRGNLLRAHEKARKSLRRTNSAFGDFGQIGRKSWSLWPTKKPGNLLWANEKGWSPVMGLILRCPAARYARASFANSDSADLAGREICRRKFPKFRFGGYIDNPNNSPNTV